MSQFMYDCAKPGPAVVVNVVSYLSFVTWHFSIPQTRKQTSFSLNWHFLISLYCLPYPSTAGGQVCVAKVNINRW